MADYQKMYYILFNSMSESCERMLTAIHQAEEMYLDDDSNPVNLVPNITRHANDMTKE